MISSRKLAWPTNSQGARVRVPYSMRRSYIVAPDRNGQILRKLNSFICHLISEMTFSSAGVAEFGRRQTYRSRRSSTVCM